MRAKGALPEVASGVSRRARAILAADVQGYGLLVDRSALDTARSFPKFRAALLRHIEKYAGDVFSVAGDGFFAEFETASAALSCAVETQRSVARLNDRRKGQPILFRMAVTFGEVFEAGGVRHGRAINAAARIQAKADAGGIFVTQSVHDEVSGEQELDLQDLGTHVLKNISRPAHLYRVLLQPASSSKKTAADGYSLARFERPLLAILPFDGGNDDRTRLAADCLAEDLVSDLCHYKWLGIASTAAVAHHGPKADPRVLSADLGVRYLLRGTVRPERGGLRVAFEISLGESGLAVHSERMDIGADTSRDDIARKLASTLERTMSRLEGRRSVILPPEALTARDHYLRGIVYRGKATAEGNQLAIASFRSAIALDPQFAPAFAQLAYCYGVQRDQGYAATDDGAIEEAVGLARTAIDADEDDPIALQMSGHTLATLAGDIDAGLSLIRRSLEIAPSSADGWARSSMVHVYAGALPTAERHAETAIALGPTDGSFYLPLCALGYAYLFEGRYADAAAAARRVLAGSRRPPMAYAILTAAAHYLKDDQTADLASKALLSRAPNLGAGAWTWLVVPKHRDVLFTALNSG